MQRSFIRKVVLIAALAPLLAAQTTPMGSTQTIAQMVAARVARLTKLLTLTTAQATAATTLFTTEETALTSLGTSLSTARTALTAAVETNSISAITAAATTIGTLTTQQELAEGTAEGAFYAQLTADQQTKYKELIAGGLNQGGGPFPGPGPGPGPGAGPGGPRH